MSVDNCSKYVDIAMQRYGIPSGLGNVTAYLCSNYLPETTVESCWVGIAKESEEWE